MLGMRAKTLPQGTKQAAGLNASAAPPQVPQSPLLALGRHVSLAVAAQVHGGNAVAHIPRGSKSDAAVSELLRWLFDGPATRPLDGRAVLLAAENNELSLNSPEDVNRLVTQVMRALRPEFHQLVRPSGTLPKVSVKKVTYETTVFDVLWWSGLEDHLVAPEVHNAVKAVCGGHSLSDLVPILYTHLCLLRSEPQQVLMLARTCALMSLIKKDLHQLGAAGGVDERLLDKVNKGISPEKLKEFLPGVAKELPPGVDVGVAEALLFVAEKADQGQVCKFGLRVLNAVMDDLVGRAAAHTSWQPPATVISPAACEVIVYNASGDPQTPHLPTRTGVREAFRVELGRLPQPCEQTLLDNALIAVGQRTGWKPRGKSVAVHAVRDAFKVAGLTHLASEVPVGGHLGSRRRFDELFEDETGASFIVEIDGGHHTQEISHYKRSLGDNQEADVDKALCHLDHAASCGERCPILVIDYRVVSTQALRVAFAGVILDTVDLLCREDVDMVVLGKDGCDVRALPKSHWDSRVVNGIEIRWACVVRRPAELELAA